ncbi:hypothetical protein J6590_088537 [Homalodisca vitripennis]|nr:hypothetical protein J6590_088537 [Homalodisca vitripennis]
MFVGEIGRQSSYLEGGEVAPTEDLLFITNLLVEILGESGQNESLKGFCQRKKREIGSCQNLKIKVNHFTTRSGSLLSAGVPRWSDLYAFFGKRLEKGPATSASVMPENSSVSSHSFCLTARLPSSHRPCAMRIRERVSMVQVKTSTFYSAVYISLVSPWMGRAVLFASEGSGDPPDGDVVCAESVNKHPPAALSLLLQQIKIQMF